MRMRSLLHMDCERRSGAGLAFFCAPRFLILAALAGLVGCGDDLKSANQTLYGNAAEVGAYRRQVEPVITAVNDIEMEWQSTAVGASGEATAANLATAFERLKPRLLQALEDFERIEAPPLLAPLHRDIRRLIILRLEAFDALLAGWNDADEAAAEVLYEAAEGKLRLANELIPRLNRELQQVDMALLAVADSNPVAASKGAGVGVAFR